MYALAWPDYGVLRIGATQMEAALAAPPVPLRLMIARAHFFNSRTCASILALLATALRSPSDDDRESRMRLKGYSKMPYMAGRTVVLVEVIDYRGSRALRDGRYIRGNFEPHHAAVPRKKGML